MMKTSTNKEAFSMWEAYKRSNVDSVLKAYSTRPSDAKIAAEHRILLEMHENGGYGYRVTAASAWLFSCGYLKEGGQVLVYHTKTRHEEILIDGDYHFWK